MTRPVLIMLNRPSSETAAHDDSAPALREADPAVPQLSVLDLGATRGDGVFETIAITAGRPQALGHHLDRFARSAAAVGLPAPDLTVWRDAVLAATARLAPAGEAYVKAVYTHGVEGDGRPTGWVLAAPAPDFREQREHGIRVVTLDRGLRHDVERTSPWLLAGAKTLSYAINRAALREATRRGADDVIFVSSDGLVLEGPTSTVVLRRGEALLTPGTGLGILDGTTQSRAFRFAEQHGLSTGFALIAPEELAAADGLWLLSSSRLAAPVRELDGVALPVDPGFTRALNEHLAEVAE